MTIATLIRLDLDSSVQLGLPVDETLDIDVSLLADPWLYIATNYPGWIILGLSEPSSYDEF